MAEGLRHPRALLFALGATLSAMLSLVTQILFERGLGEEGFAQWMVVNSLLVCFTTVACFGAGNFVLSEHYTGRLRTMPARAVLVRYFGMFSAAALITFWLVYAWAPLTGERTPLDVGLGVLLLATQIPITLMYAVFQLQERYVLVAFWPLYQNFLRFLVAVASCVVVITYTGAMAMWLATSVLLVVYVFMNYGSAVRQLIPAAFTAPKADTQDAPSAYARGMRFGVSEAIDALDLKTAVPLAALFLSAKEVSAVALGVLFLNAVFFFPYVFVMRYLLPSVHRYGASNSAKLARVMARSYVATVAVLLPLAVVFAVFGERIVALIAAGDYSGQKHMHAVVGAAILPLCLSILGAARFMTISTAQQLLRWRLEATALFLGVLVATVGRIDVAAPFAAILVSRAYLCLRFVLHRRSVAA